MFNGPTPELSISNKHPAILEGPGLLHELVKVYGGADLAIDFLENGSRQGMSYDSLHTLSDALAGTIVQALGGLEHTSPIVPVFLPQSPDLYIALLGILKAGKAFCPISLDTPEERIRFILEDISADIVITSPMYESSIFKERKIQPLCVDNEPCQSRIMSRKDLPPVRTDDLAYLLYTSGSTGLPKAVAVSHRAVTQSLLAHDRHIPHFSRFLQFAAPTFDVSIFEIFFPLLRGRTLVGCTRSDLLNDLPSIINQLEIDAAELTPTVVSNLLRGRESVPGLKLLLTIGEMLTQQIIDEYAGNSTKGSMLWGMYGPTEASIHCTLQPSFQKDSPVGNIGFPLDTVSAFIIDHATDSQSPEHMTILPIENVGELAIGGPQVADGYLNRPELTARAFVRHPEFGLLYRTGDKARLLANGTIECLGRIVSGQVKLRGQRVELGEIEQVILKVPGCHTAAAMIIQDSLVAFCATGSHNVSEKAILEVCASWLPKYMVPADIVVLPRMPQLPSGKVDKKNLETRYLFRERAEDIASPIPDGTGTFAIMQLIQRVLGRDLYSHTPLASVGMDSLQSIRIASMLRQEGYNLGAVDVLSARDVNDLNRICESKAIDNISDTLPSFDSFRELALKCPDLKQRQDEIGDIIPCTPLQEAMLAETIFRPEAYCNWIEVELSTSIDFTQVRDAVEILANQHEILRSGFFVNSSSRPVHFIQIIWRNLHPSQIRAVTSFSRNYSLGSTDSLLRPFQLQVNTALAKPRFLFQIYHGLYDGWSFDLLLRDLQHLLSGNSLQPQPQYRKVVEYLAQTQKDNEYNASASYWRTLLHEYHPTLLPNFNGRTMPSTSLRSMRGKSSIQTRLLFDHAREFSLAPQVMFQAALVYLIGSYIDSTDVVIGTVTSGRTLPVTGIEEITGPCIASLPLRQNLADCHTILDLLQKIQASNRDMLQHCAFPLREIAKLCGLRPREKLFDVVFVWQESLFSHHEDSAVRIIDSADDLEFTLTLEFEPHPDCIAFRVTYDPAIFPEAQINHLTHQLDDLVEQFLHQAHESLSTAGQCFAAPYLSIANPSPERKQFQHGPAFAVERWATETPEKEALVLGTIINGNMRIAKQLSYAELNREANQLAHVLLERGVGTDELICVLLDKSIELYVSILAVLKTGCGYLPVVPDSPPERIKMILEDANIKLCITKTPMSVLFQGLDSCAVLDLHTLDQSKYPTGDTDIKYNGSHLAYAVFTSGSTGTPKGVLVTQDNLMSNLDYLFGLYPTSPNSRLLQACSQAFDVSVFEIFFTWYAGMCLCTAVKDDLFQDMERSINALGVTHLSLTPTVASLINPDHVPNVEFLVTAGEALTEHVRRQWADRGLFQGYGPSETTNICTIRSSVTRDDLINNIGPPFSNTSAFVLEPDTEIFLPRGSVGELCFGGAQVFRGYQNMPQLNAQKIIQHPDYGRIYRSGDMGRLLPDDSILFTGRSDDQVKIRGQRVELGEITSTILDCPGVEDCVTFLLQFHDRAQRLVSFWVPADCVRTAFGLLPPDEHSHTLTKAYDTVNARLPSYMIPTHLVPITQMPLTVQSKVDKRLLLSEYKKLSGQYLDSVASNTTTGRDTSELTALERKIAEALAEITETPLADITRSSSFASLGLDSISAIHFFHKLKKIGFIDLSVSKILRHPTVALLSSICVQSQETASFQAPQLDVAQLIPPPVTSYLRSKFDQLGVQVQKMLPCTPLQEAMLSNTSSSADSHYHNIMTFRVAGDVERLKACWSQMLWRHDILRTVFIPTEFSGFAFVQVILASDESEIVWDELDMDEDMEDYSHRTFSSLQQLNKPPIRLATRQNETATELVFSCHHAMYDGVAIAALIDEIETLYSGVPLPEPVPYERYLQHAFSQDFKAADTFWTDTFTGFEPKFFPDLLSNSQHTTNTSTSFSYTLQVSLTEILKACRENSVSLLPVVQATWAKLLHWYVGENDVCFGNVVSGRTLPEKSLDRLVAPCFNTLPVRVNFDFGKSNLELIRQLHDLNIDCLPFQLTPLRRIQSKVLKEGGHLFDTLVIFQQPRSTLNQSIWSLEEDIGAMNFPLVCEVSQDKVMDKMNLTLHFNTNIMSKDGAENVAKTFESALQSVLTFPDSPARDTIGLPMKLAAESNTNFRTLNMQDERFLHSAFEENVVLYPDIIALDFFHAEGDRTTWTFKDLNEAANRIAHALSERNVGPEDIVPIHISKSPEFYASILGVLKVGAAFSPLNPDLPKARKDFMLSELCPKVVLCVDSSKLTCTGVLIVDANVTAVYPVTNLTIKGLASTNLAYCLYTSGSTGTPKAVSMEHSGPIHTIESSRNLVPWNHSSRLLQYAAISFDMCYFDCFLAWSFGFTLCAAEQSHMLNNVTGVIQSLATDLLDLTPSVAASLSRASVPSVKWLYCIGEAMSPHIIQEWEGACVNSYGPTEAAFCTTICSAQSDTKPNVIGKPFPSTSFAVYPLSGERVLPVFSIGELCIGGAQLARGYFGRHDLTRDKFVHKSGHRFYKSGDMVRMLGDGNFEFIGRADDQVKIRGLRVELGEINHVIQASDKSISAVTTQIMRKDVDSKDQLVAFLETRIRLDKSEQISVRKSITQTAKIGLPVYMVPQFFIFIDKIPKSLAGKVDKKALKEIFSASEAVAPYSERELGVDDVHEWTEIESCIRGVLAALSKTPEDEIQATTSIYQLGLDSISAVQVASGLRKSGINVNAVDVLKHPNCIDLAAYVQFTTPFEVSSASSFDFDTFDKRHRLDVCGKYGIKSENIEMIRPCTPLQEGMISQFLAKDGAVYFNYLRLQLDKDVDLLRLKEAWLIAMTTHCMLRTGFVHVDDSKVSFAMVHYTQQGFPLPWVELLDDTNLQSTENWIDQSKYYAVSHLQQPSWRVRIIREQQRLALDLAIFHGLFDAQSLRIIFNDVSAGYHKLPIGIPTPIEPLLSTILVETTVEDTKRRAFWENLGKNATSTRFPNLASLRYEPASPVVLTRDCTQALSDLEAGCRSLNVTLQAAGIASWASLLSAYTGETLVTCGVVLSGRTFEAAHSAAFPCITTVPFVCEVDNKKKEMFGKIMTLNADMQQHQLTPLAEAQRLMGFPNEAFFDTIFAYQKQRNEQSSQDVWTIVDERATVEYPVSIELEPKGNVLEFRLTFLPHMVPQEQAVLILNQLDHLLQEFIFEGSTTSRTAKTDQAIYSITPAKEPNLPSEVTLLHEFVEFSARRSPSSIALDFATSISDKKYTSNIWSYAELDSEGNKIANLLISHGARPGELIGVCFDKCPEASFAILGILKAGCAFVALDPGAPSARRAFIIEDSGSTIVLSMTPQSSDLPGRLKAKVLNLDELDLQSTSTTKPMLQRPIDPHDRSYCLYTSGTTGTPKGCELTHENAVQALLAFQRLFAGHWNADSRWLQFASFHFDVSVLEQYWSWSVGICVVSARRDLILEDLAQTIRVLNVTHIDLTPSLARILHPDDVPSLCKGVFITGGESLRQDILDVWGPKSVIYNGYGPTEATIGVTMYPRVPANGKPSNIGPQFDNVGSFVLKAGSDDPILRGGVGELCVSGKLVGKGYLNRPDLTTERFPYLDRFRKRVYRTGDLVRILHDGSFDFLGRIDDQVKLRGQRLEIGEINSVIKQSSTTILDVATLVLKHPKQQKDQLVSFVVIKFHAKSEPTIILQARKELEEARHGCQDKLPGYMIPTHFIALSSLPLTANNKADGRRLKDMYYALSAGDLQLLSNFANKEDGVWSEEERKIQTVLKEVLRTDNDNISKAASFFELGLDSISIIGFARALKEAGFHNAAASLVMKSPSIGRLAKSLQESGHDSIGRGSIVAAQQAITAFQHRYLTTVAKQLDIDSKEIEALAPCTPLQQGMIARSLESEQGLYYNAFYCRLGTELDEHRLRTAWEKAFVAIPVLRTVFVNTEDGFVQVVLRNPALSWIDHKESNHEQLDERLAGLKSEWWHNNREAPRKPFELHFVATPERKMFAVHTFHALYDGLSIGIVFKTVWAIYNGQTPDIGPPFHTALAYGPLQHVEGAQEFWQEHTATDPFKPFTLLAAVSNEGSVTVTRTLENLSAYEATRRSLNVTHQAIAQACWATVLSRYMKSAVSLGIIVSGRSIDFDGADRVIGPMFNTLPYQHRLQKQESWTSIVKKTHEFNVAVHPYQHTPLRDIMKWTKRNSSQPLFETLFVYQIAKVEADWVKNDIWEVEDSDAEADYPLALEVEQKGDDHLKLTLVAQGHVADNAVLNQLLDDFGKALMEMLSDPETVAEAPFVEKGSQQFIKTEEKTAVIVDEASGFEWEGDAQVIRYEIAGLAGVTIEDIKETTPIFELGLDSIDAIKLSSKLKKRGLDLPVSSIMRSLTIANMVQNMARNSPKEKQVSSEFTLVSHKQRLGDYLRHHEANPEDIEQVLPLTPLQEGMVAEMIASDYTRYYNHDILKLAPVIDVERLKRAWTTVVEQSPILRTSFIEVDDATIDFSFAQIIHRYSPEFMRYKKVDNEPDFSEIIESIRESALQKAHTAVPFHLHFIDAPDQRYVILSIAHGLYDGWSLGLLHYDVQRAYEDMFEPQPSYEPALQQILTGSGSDAAAFWGDFLANAKASTFARTDSTQSSVVHRRERSSLLDLTEITSFAKKSNITLEALGQMVYSLVLASTLRSLDIAFGAVLSGRDNDNMSNILFPTMNTVAVRTIIHGSRSEMLRYMQDNLAQIKQWQHFPLRKAQALAGVQSGLFESIFIYQKRMDDVSSTGSNLYESVQGHSDVEYPVCVEMEIVSGELIWRCAVKEEVFDDPGARELLDTLDAVLRAIITEPDAPTITFMPAGTSICGLAAFTDKDQARNHTEPANKETSSQKFGHSVTAKAIREVLAMVSQTPEEEITEGMTIFHIGLDSISAIKVSALLRKRSIALGVGEMLKAGTVKKMVQIVDERTPVAAEKEEDVRDMLQHAIEHIDRVSLLQQASLVEADVEDVLPATAGQIYMLSMWLNSNGAMFYPVFEFDVKGKIALEKLQHAWQALVVTNPILRTCLLATKDIRTPYVQAILNKPDARVIDVIGLEEQDMLDVIRDHAAKQPYAHLFISSSPHGWHLRLKIHHALYDGVSLPLLINQLKNLCNDVEAVSPPSPGLQFAFRQLIATSTSQSAVQQRRAFWTHYLRDINDQHLLPQPSAPPTRKTEVFKSGLLSDIGGIEVFARKNGVTTQALFFAVYAKLYASLTRTLATKDVVLGVYLANRSHPIPDIAQAAIPTVNLVPLRITAPLGKELVDVARQVQDGISQISGLVNAGVSLHEVAEWTGVRVDTLVNFLKLPGEVAGDGVMEQERGVSIVAREMWESDVSRVSDSTLEQRRFEGSGTLVDAWVNAAYLHAIDVEATIRDGKLDVGVFAPEEMLGLQDAEGLVEEMGRTLGGLMEGA